MGLEIRPLAESDYNEILTGWWKDWGWDAPPLDFLPGEGTSGMMVESDGLPVCAGFIYQTNSKVIWVDWIISNKNYWQQDRSDAINLLIETLTESARLMGAKYVYALIKHEGLIDTYQDHGYIQGDSYNKEMIKIFN